MACILLLSYSYMISCIIPGTTLASNSLTEEVKRALYNNNSTTPTKSPRQERSPDGESSDTQSTEAMTPTRRLGTAAFPQEDDKQLLMELINPRRTTSPSGALGAEQRVHVKRVTSNRYQDSDSDSDSGPSSPQYSSRNESMFTHTDSLRSSVRSSVVSSEGRITIVTEMDGMSDMEVASVDIPVYQNTNHSREHDIERYVSDPHGYGYNNSHLTVGRTGSNQRTNQQRQHSPQSDVSDSQRTRDTHGDGYHSNPNKHHGNHKNSHSSHSDSTCRDGSHRDGSYRGSPQSSRSSQGHEGRRHPQANHRSAALHSPGGSTTRERDLSQREVYSASSDSDNVHDALKVKERSKVNSRSRTPSPVQHTTSGK